MPRMFLVRFSWSYNMKLPKYQMSSRRLAAITAMPQVERPVAQCAEVLLGQGPIWSAPAINKKTSSNGTTEQKQLTCYSWHGKNKSDLLGLFILFTLFWSCCKDGWKAAPNRTLHGEESIVENNESKQHLSARKSKILVIESALKSTTNIHKPHLPLCFLSSPFYLFCPLPLLSELS